MFALEASNCKIDSRPVSFFQFHRLLSKDSHESNSCISFRGQKHWHCLMHTMNSHKKCLILSCCAALMWSEHHHIWILFPLKFKSWAYCAGAVQHQEQHSSHDQLATMCKRCINVAPLLSTKLEHSLQHIKSIIIKSKFHIVFMGTGTQPGCTVLGSD